MTSDPGHILRERARALAQRRADPHEAGERRTLVTWERRGQRLGLEIGALQAITETGHVAAVPHAEPPLVGMIAFQGALVPVYDPSWLVTGEAGQDAPTGPWTVVVDDAAAPFGLLADGLPDMTAAMADQLHSPSADLPPAMRRHVAGVTRDGRVVLAHEALRTDLRSQRPSVNADQAERPTS